MKKVFALGGLSLIFILPIFAIGIDMNFRANVGIAECFFGNQIEKNVNFWEDSENFGKFINHGAAITTNIIFTQDSFVETGLIYANNKLNFCCTDNVSYSNGIVRLSYQEFKIPLIYDYSFTIKKTTEVISSLVVGVGINVSYKFGNELYKDDITTFAGSFISPKFNVEAVIQSYYSHKIGPGKAFVGLSLDLELLQNEYYMEGKKVNVGNGFSVTPMIGYTFIIKEDKGLSKITEKNKRIKDLDVN